MAPETGAAPLALACVTPFDWAWTCGTCWLAALGLAVAAAAVSHRQVASPDVSGGRGV